MVRRVAIFSWRSLRESSAGSKCGWGSTTQRSTLCPGSGPTTIALWTSQTSPDSAGGKGSSGVWRVSKPDPKPAHRLRVSPDCRPRLLQACRPPHRCLWEYSSFLMGCLGAQNATQSLLQYGLQPQSLLQWRLQPQSSLQCGLQPQSLLQDALPHLRWSQPVPLLWSPLQCPFLKNVKVKYEISDFFSVFKCYNRVPGASTIPGNEKKITIFNLTRIFFFGKPFSASL